MTPQNRAEWIRFLVQTGGGLALNLGVLAWYLSGTVADFRAQLGDHDRTLARHESAIDRETQINIRQEVKQGQTDTTLAAIAQDVRDMKGKVDAIYQRTNAQ